jgi:hypothetical protein
MVDGLAFTPIVQRVAECLVRRHRYIGMVFVGPDSEPIAAEESVRLVPPRGALHWMMFYGLTGAGFHVMQHGAPAIYPIAVIAAADAGCGIEVWREGLVTLADPAEPLLLLPSPIRDRDRHSLFER